MTSSVTYADGMRTSAAAAYAPTNLYSTQFKNITPGRGFLLALLYHFYDVPTHDVAA